MRSKYLVNEYPLLVLPTLAAEIGLNEAIILQQMHYWINRSNHQHEGVIWFYKSYEEWKNEFPFWSISTIKRAVYNLENKGLIKSTDEYNQNATDRTKWYTINYDELDRAFQNDTLEDVNLTRSRAVQNDTLLHYTDTTQIPHTDIDNANTPSKNGSKSSEWIFTLYLEIFKEPVTNGEHDDLKDLAEIYAPADVKEAFKITRSKDARQRITRKVAYSAGILKDWAANGKPHIVAENTSTPITPKKVYR